MTRLLLKLKSTEDSPYLMEYHHDIQGLIYNILKGSEYDVHNKEGYKFFNFSNIFPFHDLRKGDIRNLLISSPNDNFTSFLKQQLDYLRDIRIGQMKFTIDRSDKLNIILPRHNFSLITGSPILVLIHRYRYEEIGYESMLNGYKATYWESDHPLELFITQLQDNLIKKYNECYETKIENQDIFYKFKFLKQVATRLHVKENKIVIGTTWEFDFARNSKLIQFALDCGLGQSNSMGFGFMNVKSKW